MAFTHGNVHSDTAKKEQIITEFFAKTLHIILESRAPFVSSRNYSGDQAISSPSSSNSSSSSYRPRDKWFNLALRECPAALENIDFWRQSNLDPMVVDVVLVSSKRDVAKNPNYMNSEKTEKVIERWVVQYENRKSNDGSGSSSKRSGGNLHTLYKKSILLLRSLYATVRLLPAYKLFRELISSGQIRNYTLTHRVSSFVEPFTRKEEADMNKFFFTPVDTSSGRLCLSVLYHNSANELNNEPSAPMSPQFIPDYVGSPLADPLKRFPTLPVSQSSPSYSPFSRQHSWSYGTYRASSPSPTYSDSQASVSKPKSGMPPMSLPHHLQETFQPHIKYAGFDENWPSPAFSPSTSPSPVYSHGVASPQTLLRCESAPVRISAIRAPGALILSNKHLLPPSPPLKIMKPEMKTEKSSGAEGSGGEKFSLERDESGRFSGVRISSNSSPRVSISRSSSRLSVQDDDSEFACPFAVDDDDMIYPGSRQGSDLSRKEENMVDMNYCDMNKNIWRSDIFATTYVTDREVIVAKCPTVCSICIFGRPDSYNPRRQASEPFESGGSAPLKKSQDAAVGALVLMLKKAPPLRNDRATNPTTLHASTPPKRESIHDRGQSSEEAPDQLRMVSSGFTLPKTTTDALAELRSYSEMKEQLLKQSGGSMYQIMKKKDKEGFSS